MVKVQIAKPEHAESFSKVWTYNKVAIFMDKTHKQFAVDFANMMIASFIEDQQRRAAEAAKPKVALVEG